MTFNPTDIQKFDSSGYYQLADEYILSYLYSDGWTERLLSIGIYIDIYFGCKITLSFYSKNQKHSEPNESQPVSEVPQIIKDLLQKLKSPDFRLQVSYGDTFWEDTSREHFVINHNGKSHNCSIGILSGKSVTENESEKLFFQLQSEFETWREKIYHKAIQTIK